MLFPVPINESYEKEYYCLKESYQGQDLYTFWKEVKEGNADITFCYDRFFRKEEYQIQLNGEGVTVHFSSEEGKFRAVTSLYLLYLEDGEKLPYGMIHDYPEFERRGFMLDISGGIGGGKVPKMDVLKQFIDRVALLKYNEFQLYMESLDCYRYEAYPQYTEGKETLTGEDMEELDRYCKERFIDLVPNQNSLGHLQDWMDLEDFAHLRVGDENHISNTINITKPEAEEFINNLYQSLLPHFSSRNVNVGLDEAYGLGKYQLKELCDKEGYANVFINYLTKIHETTKNQYGKNAMFWDDLIIHYPEVLHRVPKGAIALDWGYDQIQSQMMGEHCAHLAANGVEFYVVPGNSMWNSNLGRSDCMIFNVRTAGEVGRNHGAKGYLLTDWGNNFLSMLYFPLALAAQYAWNVGEKQGGGQLKNEFVWASEHFCDKFIYSAKVTEYLKRLGNYYLLEPQLVHNATLSSYALRFEFEENQLYFSNLDEFDNEYYFGNVIEYIEKIKKDVLRTKMEETLLRQILINCEVTILGAQLVLAKTTRKNKEYIQILIEKIDLIEKEYTELWNMFFLPRNDMLRRQLAARKKEMADYILTLL